MCQDGERAPARKGTDPAAVAWQPCTSHHTWELVTGGGTWGTAGDGQDPSLHESPDAMPEVSGFTAARQTVGQADFLQALHHLQSFLLPRRTDRQLAALLVSSLSTGLRVSSPEHAWGANPQVGAEAAYLFLPANLPARGLQPRVGMKSRDAACGH